MSEKKCEIGMLYKDALFLRFNQGEANDNDGNEYDLSTDAGGSPIIQNTKTNIYYHVSWKDLLMLAKKFGIDNAGSL